MPAIRTQSRLDPLDHGRCAHASHACVIMRALRQSPEITRRTRQIGAHDCVWSMIRPNVNRIGRAEYAHYWTVQGNGKMHRAGIVGHAYGRSLHNGCEFGRSGPAGIIDCATAKLGNLLAARPIVSPT